ncbi:MAG: glycosyltransferase [Acidobacteria bacterium]|nr:glycosyltransferase [Acidobacteriota bacterium]
MKRRLKVLHFISFAGRSPFFCAVAEHANRDDFEIIVASLSPTGPLLDDMKERGIQTFALDCTRRAQYPRAVFRLAAWLRRERIDVIQTHLFDASLVGLMAARLARTPLSIFTGHHSHEIPLYRRRALLWADCLSSRWLSHHVIAHSVDMKEIFVQYEGVPPEKIAVIPLGFELDRWNPSTAGRERVRTELSLGGKVVFGAVGRMYWIKDYPTLFKAFAPIAAKMRETMLLVVGDGQDREQLERLARELSLEERIIFTGQRSDIVDVLSAVDVFVHPSLAESFGQVIVEALALGKPVVSTDVGVSREIIENGVNGFLVPTGNSAALQEAMEKILRLRDGWEEMGRNGQKRVQGFAVEKIEPAFEAQYVAWLKERRS